MTLLLCACSGIGVQGDATERFATSGGSDGSYSDAKYFVLLDETTSQSAESDRLMRYASYVLKYRYLPETSIRDDADYLVIVSYVDSKANAKVQTLQLTGVSSKVYAVLRETRPAWIAVSKHLGKPIKDEMMLPMHILSIRDFTGRNSTMYQAGMEIKLNDPILADLVMSVDGKQ